MKKLTSVVIILLISLGCDSNKEKTMYLDFSEAVHLEIKTGIQHYRTSVHVKTEDFFLAVDSIKESRTVLLSYCSDCGFRDVLDSSKFMVQIDTIEIPLVELSRILVSKAKTNERVYVWSFIGGKQINIDKDGKITSISFND